MSDARDGLGRGRRRQALKPPKTAMVELGHDMRQQRLAAGVNDMAYAVELVQSAMPLGAPPVTAPYLADVERGNSGHGARSDWVEEGGDRPGSELYRVHVSYALVEAYDTAFGADGYLVDVYDWAKVRDQEHSVSPPTALPPVPDRSALDAALAALREGFNSKDEVAGPVLAECEAALRLAHPGWRDPARREKWLLEEGQRDRSTFVNELNEFRDGQLVEPGGVLIGSWPLRNTGEVPWRDRLLFRVSQGDAAGIHAPRFVPVPDTDPGGVAVIRAPLRAPQRPGTYQICFKIGWPNGVYCHPTTMVGVVATLVVPPPGLSAWWHDGSPVIESGQPPETPMTDPELGPLLSAARKKARLSQAQLGKLLNELPAGKSSVQTISHVERGASRPWPLYAWHAAARALERFDEAASEVGALRSALPPMLRARPPARSTMWTTDDRRDHLRAIVADLTATPPRRRFTRTVTQLAWSPYARAEEVLSRLDAGSTERPSAKDRWEMLEPLSPGETDIGKNEYFAIQVELRNTGEVPWKGRLLSRLGVPVTSVLPMTPRVLSVPDTEPGGRCSVTVPGRPAHLVGVAEIHFIMTFADLRPCFPDDRRTIRLVLETTTTVGAQETQPVPVKLVQAARKLILGRGAAESS
jgi:transcriptional regulator with XRE-family HTH domain